MSRSRGNTRERILRETWRLLEASHGPGVRMEDVAQAAGVSRQAVYLHFGSRTDLFVATARYVDETLHVPERLQEVCAATSAEEGIDAFVAFWASYMPEIHGLATTLLSARETDEAAAAAWDDRMRALREGCVAVLQCAVRDGTLAPQWTLQTAADLFYGMQSIPLWEQLTGERGWSQAEYIARLQVALKRMLLRTEPE